MVPPEQNSHLVHTENGSVRVEEGDGREGSAKEAVTFKMAPLPSLTYKWNSAFEKESLC